MTTITINNSNGIFNNSGFDSGAEEQGGPFPANWDAEFGALGPENLPVTLRPEIECAVHWVLSTSGQFVPAPHAVSVNLNEYQGAILDLDGFLVNSEKPILKCIFLAARDLARESVGDSEYQFSGDVIKRIKAEAFGRDDTNMTLNLRKILEETALFPQSCQGLERDVFVEKFRNMRVDYFNHLIERGEFKALAGAVDFIKRLSNGLNGKVAIFTGSPERNADQEISAIGLDSWLPKEFRVYTSSLPAGRGKPKPDGFFMARDRLGLQSGDQWISGGDRANDWHGAISAEGCGLFLFVPEDIDQKQIRNRAKEIVGGKVALPENPDKLIDAIKNGKTKLVILGGLTDGHIDMNF